MRLYVYLHLEADQQSHLDVYVVPEIFAYDQCAAYAQVLTK